MMNRHIKEKQRINQVSNIANKYSKKDAKSIANILQKTKSSHQREAENQTGVKYCLWEIIAGTKYCWWEIISNKKYCWSEIISNKYCWWEIIAGKNITAGK